MKFKMIPSILITLIAISVAFCGGKNTVPGEQIPPVNPDDLAHTSAKSCSTCHKTIYDQWKGSMHANSTALSDPIHAHMYKKVMGEPTQENLRKNGKYPMCLKCHAPLAALDKKTDLTSHPVYNEGVSCVVCHGVEAYHGPRNAEGKMNYGIDAFDFSHDRKVLQAASGRIYAKEHDDLAAHYHVGVALEGSTTHRTNQLCMGCHDMRFNGKGTPVCETGKEYRESESQVNCVNCHMPVVNGLVDHGMMGGHSRKQVARGVMMTAKGVQIKNGAELTLVIKNRLPHKFPTGAPFRNVIIEVEAVDEKGKIIWKNFSNDVQKESPKSFLAVELTDKNGKPVPTPAAEKIHFDTRLKPFEERTIKYSIQPESGKRVAAVRARAIYSLLRESQKGQIKELDDKLKGVSEVAAAEVRFD